MKLREAELNDSMLEPGQDDGITALAKSTTGSITSVSHQGLGFITSLVQLFCN